MASRPAEFDAESRKDRTISNQAKEIERLRQQLAVAESVIGAAMALLISLPQSERERRPAKKLDGKLVAYDAAKGGGDANNH